jgi:hypothetical protein
LARSGDTMGPAWWAEDLGQCPAPSSCPLRILRPPTPGAPRPCPTRPPSVAIRGATAPPGGLTPAGRGTKGRRLPTRPVPRPSRVPSAVGPRPLPPAHSAPVSRAVRTRSPLGQTRSQVSAGRAVGGPVPSGAPRGPVPPWALGPWGAELGWVLGQPDDC